MKAWVLAVGLSLGLHGGLVLMFRGAEVVEVLAAPAPAEDSFVAFTPVVAAAPSAPAAVAAPVIRKALPARPEVDLVMGLPAGDLALGDDSEGPHPDPLPLGGEGDSVVASAETPGPHPDPLPKGEGDSVDVVALVHARLAAMAEGCYPAAARRFQQRGTVQLSFCLDATGGAASTSITQSSGAALLDAAAQGCVVQKAAPFPPEAASRCFSVPVRFGAR